MLFQSSIILQFFYDPMQTVASVSCPKLTEVPPGVVFCCYSRSALTIKVHVEPLQHTLVVISFFFELLFPFYQLEAQI